MNITYIERFFLRMSIIWSSVMVLYQNKIVYQEHLIVIKIKNTLLNDKSYQYSVR